MSLDRFKELRVMIGIIDHGSWCSKFAQCLRAMEQALKRYQVGEYKKQHIRTMVTTGSILPRSRYITLKAAREMNADYLLFIDTDQTFPRNMLHRLVKHKVDVVGANIAVKLIPSKPTARGKPPEGELHGPKIFTDPESTGLQEVWHLGTGVLMFSKKVMQALPNTCFEMIYVPELDDYQGEDWSLCNALHQLGFKIFVDHDLSKEVGHLGEFEYTHDVVGEIEDVDRPEPRQTETAEATG